MRIETFGFVGDADLPSYVRVELRLERGFLFRLSGISTTSVRAMQARIRSALFACGYRWPGKGVTVNISPATENRTSTKLDLPIAIAILASEGIIPKRAICEFSGSFQEFLTTFTKQKHLLIDFLSIYCKNEVAKMSTKSLALHEGELMSFYSKVTKSDVFCGFIDSNEGKTFVFSEFLKYCQSFLINSENSYFSSKSTKNNSNITVNDLKLFFLLKKLSFLKSRYSSNQLGFYEKSRELEIRCFKS